MSPNVRFHIVTAGAAVATSITGAAIYMLLSGERGGLELLGWVVMLLGVTYPSLLASMRSERPVRCTVWLKRLASGAH